MDTEKPSPQRFFGLDIHKRYLVAVAVDPAGNRVYGPRRVAWSDLESWRDKTLAPHDALVIEMTTNTWQVYDELSPYVLSVTVVHPPHVRLVTEPEVMNDRIAAFNLALLLSKGMLKGIWIPTPQVRERRALIAQRSKMTRLATQAKNRLHAVLHRHQILPPQGDPFHPDRRSWWLALPISPVEKVRLLSDLDTLAFARHQIANLENCIQQIAAGEPRLPLLLQLPGFGILNALTVLAAIGDISRFPDAKHLVGYAGMGGRIHDSGQTTRTGKVTKAGRRDLRAALVEAAGGGLARTDQGIRRPLCQPDPGGLLDVRFCAQGAGQEPLRRANGARFHPQSARPSQDRSGGKKAPMGRQDLHAPGE